jgi:WD40 repeat protein
MGVCPSAPAAIASSSAPHPPLPLPADAHRALPAAAGAGGVTACVCAPTGALFVGHDSGHVSRHARPWRSGGSATPLLPPRCWSAHGARAVTRLALGGGLLASASRDGTAALWRADDDCGGASDGAPPPAAPLAVLRGHELTVSAVSIAADGRRVATGSRDCSVRVWDAGSGGGGGGAPRELCAPAHVAQNVVTCLQWAAAGSSGDGGGGQHVLLQGGEDLRVRLWDARAGLLRQAGALEGFTYFPLALDAAPNGHHVATASKGFNGVGCEVRLWDLRRLGGGGGGGGGAPLLRTLAGHSQDATAVLFVSQGRLASASKDGTVRVGAPEEGGGAAAGAAPLVLPVPGAGLTCLAAAAEGLVAGCVEAPGLVVFEGAGVGAVSGW